MVNKKNSLMLHQPLWLVYFDDDQYTLTLHGHDEMFVFKLAHFIVLMIRWVPKDVILTTPKLSDVSNEIFHLAFFSHPSARPLCLETPAAPLQHLHHLKSCGVDLFFCNLPSSSQHSSCNFKSPTQVLLCCCCCSSTSFPAPNTTHLIILIFSTFILLN